MVADAHTHPKSCVFSNSDMDLADVNGISVYLVGPDLDLQRFDPFASEAISLGKISPVALTDAQRAALAAEFQISWDTHLRKCTWCYNVTWPVS